MPFLLLFISIFPVLVILLYIYKRDKYEKEPIGLLIKAFFAGVLSAVITIIVVVLVMPYLPRYDSLFSAALVESFIEAAIPEELFKFLMLYWVIWKNKNFNEKFDGIVYAVFVSLGFACLENIFYVFENGVAVGLLRAVLSVPAHALFGIIMGFYLSLARFNPENKGSLILKSLVFSMVAHGIFDFLLLYGSKNAQVSIGIMLLAFLLFFIFVIWLWRLGFKKLKQFSLPPDSNENIPEIP
ncbi:MAG: Protease PrsW [Bacteroidetes bacterium ADurb.Bin408]|nr:MAG: Protease PrsW [Bacteroidetes bacterium ADurb.Bin408]